jgi:hypothetical protein
VTLFWTLLRAYWKQALIVIAVLFAVWWIYDTGHDNGKAEGKAEVQEVFDAYKAQVAEERRKSEEKARAIEASQRTQIEHIATTYEAALDDSEAKGKRVAADLRAGTLRLRNEWATCRTGLPTTTTDSNIPDADTIVRERLAGDIVRIGARCDAQLNGLQAAFRAMSNVEYTQ